jgi:hypothetical protein
MSFQEGDICRMVDVNGEDAGLAIFLEKIPPYSLSRNDTDFANFWNWKVLTQGEVKYLNTNNWTLLQL